MFCTNPAREAGEVTGEVQSFVFTVPFLFRLRPLELINPNSGQQNALFGLHCLSLASRPMIKLKQ